METKFVSATSTAPVSVIAAQTSPVFALLLLPQQEELQLLLLQEEFDHQLLHLVREEVNHPLRQGRKIVWFSNLLVS